MITFLKHRVKAFIKGFKVKLLSIAFSRNKFHLRKAITVFCEVRGGSTWIVEMLSHIPNSIIQWEPLNKDKGVVPPNFRFGWRPYIKPDNEKWEYRELFEKILTFKIFNYWTLKMIPSFGLLRILKGKYLITKFTRGNMLLPWFLNQFDLEHKPIVLLRHPIATCLSHIQTFPSSRIDDYTDPEYLNSDRYVENQEFISGLGSKLEKRLALWCIDNLHLIDNIDIQSNCHIVYYEHLLMNPEEEMKKLWEVLGFEWNSKKNMQYRRPSISDYDQKFDSDPFHQLKKWQEHLDDNTLASLQRVLDYYNCTRYHSNSPLPILNQQKKGAATAAP